MENKRGLSGIIVVLIIIGLSLVLIGVVWMVVSGVTSESSEEIETTSSRLNLGCSDLGFVKVNSGQKCYGEEITSREGTCCDDLVYPDLKDNLVVNWEMIGDNSELDEGWSDLPETLLFNAPLGENYVHDSWETSSTGCYNWARSDLIPADISKSYKFSVYIKSTDLGMNNYFGFYLYNSSQDRIALQWSNPYFKTSENDLSQWVKWEGILGASNLGSASQCDTDWTNGNDWCMSSETAYIMIRFGSCYSDGDATGHTYFAYPSIEEGE